MEQLEEIRALADLGDWLKVEHRGKELLKQNPENGQTMSLVAYSLQQQGRLREALDLAEAASKRTDDQWLSLYIAGVSALGMALVDQAYRHLRAALDTAPNHSETLRQFIKASAAVNGLDTAAAEYEQHQCTIRKTPMTVVAPLKSVRDWAKDTGAELLEVGEEEEIPFEQPHVWGQPISAERINLRSNKPYVAEIRNARILSRSSLVLTEDGTALNDAGGHPTFGTFVDFSYDKAVVAQSEKRLLLDLADYETRESEDGMVLSGLGSDAFGHWLPEFLPKLQFFMNHPDFAKLPIIVDADMPQSHFDHLTRLVKNRVLRLPAEVSLRCSRVLMAPSPTFYPVEMLPNDIPFHEIGAISPRAMVFIRGEEACVDETSNARIFLGRKRLRWRRLLNEEEIAADLAELGFEVRYLEEMTAFEQIALFRSADWIVAPNGSSILNLVFAPRTAKLIVLSQPNLFGWGTFSGSMSALGYRTVFVCGDERDWSMNKHADYRVPILRVRSALAGMGLKEARSLRDT